MVRVRQQGDKTLYLCEVCGTAYPQEEWAGKCQKWCQTHEGSCNLDIIQHAVPLEDDLEGKPA